jgi:uncharacterized protein (TIRG00374 family)
MQSFSLIWLVAMTKRTSRKFFAGLLIFAALVFAVTHYGELSHVFELMRSIDPAWIMLAFLFQICTYIALALVWHRAFTFSGVHYPVIQLVPLAIAKLFADQAFPSGGISGIAFVVKAFRHRDVSGVLGMGVMLLGVLSYYLAFALVAAAALFVLWTQNDIHEWIIVVAAIFFVVAVLIPAAILLVKRWGAQERLPAWLIRLPVIAGILETFSDVPDDTVRNPLLLAGATVYQTAVFLLDAATLWAMLQALGEPSSFLTAFPCFVVASIVAMLSLIPLGLGTFEVTCVGLLVTLGIKVETALTATLLLRGFTLWLPMIPGLVFTRWELR